MDTEQETHRMSTAITLIIIIIVALATTFTILSISDFSVTESLEKLTGRDEDVVGAAVKLTIIPRESSEDTIPLSGEDSVAADK